MAIEGLSVAASGRRAFVLRHLARARGWRRVWPKIPAMWLLVWAASACVQTRADVTPSPTAACTARLIVRFADERGVPAWDTLSNAVGAQIVARSTIGAALYAVDLSVAGPQADCDAATERLRRLPEVRYVELDRRRRIDAR